LNSLEAVVATLRRSDARSSAPRFFVHAAVGMAAWTGAVLLVTPLVPFERRFQLALVGIPVMLVVAAFAWLASRPGPGVLMSVADQSLGLKERLSTAWERRASSGLMDDFLRRDALLQAERARLTQAFPVRINRREVGVLAIVAAAALVLAVMPNPMDQLLAQRRADAASQATAANAVHDVQNKIAANATVPADPKVQKILAATEKQIRQAPDPRQALQAITPAEQQLLQLSDPQTPARTSTAQNLAGSLSATKAGAAAAQALTASPAKGAQALRQLAAQLQSLSPQERAQLAQALATAAQHAQDPTMAASLSSASSALAAGDLATAAAALSNLAGQLDSLQAQQNTDAQVAAAISSLETARSALAAQADRDAAAASGTASAGASPGASPAAGNGNGNGSGSGSGNGSGSGSGTGSGSGSGSGSGGTGGTGASGSGSGSGQGTTPTEKLFVPGQPVPGQFENDPTPLGPGQNVPLTPYTQVVQAYRQAALDATSQSLIPGSEQDLVRQYFSTLGGS
jgi:hypothetical protein